jgi:hypothetical protein
MSAFKDVVLGSMNDWEYHIDGEFIEAQILSVIAGKLRAAGCTVPSNRGDFEHMLEKSGFVIIDAKNFRNQKAKVATRKD